MSSLQMTVIIFLLVCDLQTMFAHLKQFRFHGVDRNSVHWRRIKDMQCTHKPIQNDVPEIWRCIYECTNDTESFMVGTNASHCILCYYQVNGATFNPADFQGTLLFKRGKLGPLLLPSKWYHYVLHVCYIFSFCIFRDIERLSL